MDANERYERLAKQFKRDTGLLAPGKDAPAAVGADPEYDTTYRQQEWDKWLKGRQSHTTLTQMLNNNFCLELEGNSNRQVIEDEISTIKTTIKEWLRTVGLPEPAQVESTRNLLITLVDEP